jgi:NADPH2:quinone reductase
VLELVEDAPVPEPGDGQVLVRVSRAGVNFADTHARDNSYLSSYGLPLTPGAEVAARRRRVPAPRRGVGRGRARPDRPGPLGLAPAADLLADAGGRERRGPRGRRRRRLARRPARQALRREPELATALREANEGAKVDIVLEMAGGRVFDQSLRVLAPFGRLVTYGMASREPNTVASGALMARSQAVIGFWLMHCFGRPGMVAEPLQELFELVASGGLRVVEGAVTPANVNCAG